MKLLIKNTVNLERLIYVRNELDRMGLQSVSVEVNEINTTEPLTSAQYTRMLQILQQAGIAIFEDRKDILVQKIKNLILEIVYHREEPLVLNLSAHLARALGHDYTYMSNLFSETQNITIEKFYICQKIERVKELLVYEKMSLTEIALKMHYSSLAHLSSQFRKVTGMTTSQFKQQFAGNNLPPDNC